MNNFNIMMNQLCLVDIKFDDEIKKTLLLTSLQDTWDGMVTIVSNSLDNLKLNFGGIIELVLNK